MQARLVKRNREKGVALLMALVVLAIASSLAVAQWFNNQLNMSKINNLKQSIQARHHAQGLLLWAGDILREDREQEEWPHDTSSEAWLQGIQGLVVEDAMLSGTLLGMNGCFNLNNLVINGQLSQPHLAFFQRLLLDLELDQTIAEKVIDWIDPDQVPMPNGAEDFVYLAKSPGYQTASQSMQHINELQNLEGMNQGVFNLLSQHVCALPVNQNPTRMNVNTMSVPLLKALDPAITSPMALKLYQEGRTSHQRIEDFFEQELIRYVLFEKRTELRQLIDVQTTHLEARAAIQMGDQVFQSYAMLRRNQSGGAQVLSRAQTPYLNVK